VYEEKMPAAAGGPGIVSPHVTVRKNSQQLGAWANREKGFERQVTENTENAKETKKKRRNSRLRP
jgi:hypothetical protein